MAITIDGSGTITGINAGGLPDGSVTADDLATDSVTTAKIEDSAITTAKLPSGSVIKVVSQTKTDTANYTSSSSDYSSVIHSATITPESTTNKILIQFNGCFAATLNQRFWVALTCNGTIIDAATGDASGLKTRASSTNVINSSDNELKPVSANFLHSPASTDPQIYGFVMGAEGGNTVYCNRSVGDSNSNTVARGITTITLTEVVA